MELTHLDDIQLQQYLESPDSLTEREKEHLEQCSRCRAELHHYRKLTENIVTAQSRILPETFVDKVMAKIKTEAVAVQPVEDNFLMQIFLATAMSLAGVVVVLYFFFGFDRIVTQFGELYSNAIHIEKWSLVIYVKAQMSKMGATGELLLAAGLIILLFLVLDKYLSKVKPGRASLFSV